MNDLSHLLAGFEYTQELTHQERQESAVLVVEPDDRDQNALRAGLQRLGYGGFERGESTA